MPTNVLTGNYRVFTYPAWDRAKLPNYAAITATADGTMVTFTSTTSTTSTQAGGPLAALTPGQSASFTLDQGDTIEIMSNETGADVSGS